MAYGQVLTALADPTRRKLFEHVHRREYMVGELATALRITQPAVSQHLRVLRDAGLVTHRCKGACRYYRPAPAGLAELRKYVESLWDEALEAFAADDPARKKKGRVR
jgi:DNA-binding transcriptional ArsR family regulator